MYSPWIQRVAVTLLVLMLAPLGGADTIVYDGQTYTDVSIHESGSRYYFRLPDGTAVSVSKSDIGPGQIAFGDAPLGDAGVVDEAPEVTMPEEVIEPVLEEAPAPEETEAPEEMETPEPAAAPEVEEVAEPEAMPKAAEPAEEAPVMEEVATEEVVEEVMEAESAAPSEEEAVAAVEETSAAEAPAASEDVMTFSGSGELMAGASRLVVTEPGQYDEPLELNALVLKVGEVYTGFVSLDAGALDKRLTALVTEKLTAIGSELPGDSLFIGATGVHAGYHDGMMQGVLKESIYGDFNEEVLNSTVEQVVQGLTDAVGNLQPAQVLLGDADAPDLHTARADVNATTDSTLSAMAVQTADGTPLAYLVNFALLPPVLFGDAPVTDRGLVGDLASALRKTGGEDVPVLFFNGAAGDVAASDVAAEQGGPLIGDTLAERVLGAIEGAEAKGSVSLEVRSERVLLPPTLLSEILPKQTWARAIHLDDTVFVSLPQAVAGQVGLLLRVKAQQEDMARVFLCSQTNDFQGYAPSLEEFFVIGPYAQLAFHGPLIMKWYADNFLPGGDGDTWKTIPMLGQHATAFETGVAKGKEDAEKIASLWETTSGKLDTLVGMLKAFSAQLPEEYRPLLERLNNKTLSIVGKQVAGTFLRGEVGGLTEEQRAVMMGVSEGSQVPFDAVLILYAAANFESLPDQVKLGLTMAKINEGYNPLAE
jgi:hypothetical protein